MTYADQAELFWLAAYARRHFEEYSVGEILRANQELRALRHSAYPMIAERAREILPMPRLLIAGGAS